MIKKYCVECDGFDFHNTKDQIKKDNERASNLLFVPRGQIFRIVSTQTNRQLKWWLKLLQKKLENEYIPYETSSAGIGFQCLAIVLWHLGTYAFYYGSPILERCFFRIARRAWFPEDNRIQTRSNQGRVFVFLCIPSTFSFVVKYNCANKLNRKDGRKDSSSCDHCWVKEFYDTKKAFRLFLCFSAKKGGHPLFLPFPFLISFWKLSFVSQQLRPELG